MTKLIDLTGQRFGCLVVKGREGSYRPKRPDDGHSEPTWRCRCDCGNESFVLGCNLKAGRTKSCGCFQKQKLKERNAVSAAE